ncbi:MAG: UDP-N-acetylmuramoyl-L-alanine--D-glutamate ligase [Pontixanthobacter sp.]
MITSPNFAGKKYAVLGLARSGLAAAEALIASGAQVTAWDRQDVAREKLNGQAQIADPLEIDLTGFAGVVVSPGVPLNTHPIAEYAARYDVPIIGDIELFAQARGDLPPHSVIGITGTNGKSTTTALLHHICRSAGMPSLMGGNIGVPIMAQDALADGGVYVLELSSYQIDLTRSLDCEIAMLLNITPDHLDRYDGFAGYAASKLRLFAMQSEGRNAIVDRLSFDRYGLAGQAAGDGSVFIIEDVATIGDPAEWPALQGPHNEQNAAAAIAAARALGMSDRAISAALETFTGLPHRMEVVCTTDGVIFVNDSKATNPASAAPALAAYSADPQSRVHWIVGGLAKEDGLGECAEQLGNVKAAYTIGEAGPRFAELLEGRVPVRKCELMCEAVRNAVDAATPDDVILLSPACASFDQFRDYEARGDAFRNVVAALTGCTTCGDHGADTVTMTVTGAKA